MVEAAFAHYPDSFGPFVLQKWKAALRLVGTLTPNLKVSLFLRNQIFNRMGIQWVADLAAGRDLLDNIALPERAADFAARGNSILS